MYPRPDSIYLRGTISCSLHTLSKVVLGGTSIGASKGDSWSLDYSSLEHQVSASHVSILEISHEAVSVVLEVPPSTGTYVDKTTQWEHEGLV